MHEVASRKAEAGRGEKGERKRDKGERVWRFALWGEFALSFIITRSVRPFLLRPSSFLLTRLRLRCHPLKFPASVSSNSKTACIMRFLPTLCSLLTCVSLCSAHEVGNEIADATNAFLKSLGDEQKAKAVFPFPEDGSGERVDWHFIPKSRVGLPLKEMTPAQQKQAKALLKLNLSETGFKKVETIRDLEGVLRDMEKNGSITRDPDLYFVSVFGKPGKDQPWGWRWEGHHLSLNFTFVPGQPPSVTPSFLGSNPGEVMQGPLKGLRLLAKEEDLARALVKSLNEGQLKQARIMDKAPSDVINVPGRNDTKPEGITYDALDAGQQKQLVALMKEYLFRVRTEIAEDEWARVQNAGLQNLHFAWAGGLEAGEPHYYRVQLHNFVLEYDNTQNDAKHVHALWRDFDRDFGNDALADHYKKHKH